MADERYRSYLAAVSVTQYSPSVLDTIVNQTLVSAILPHASKYDSTTTRLQFWGGKLGGLDPNLTIAFTFEPFQKDLFSYGSESAYPPDRSHTLFPSDVAFVFGNASLDDAVIKGVRSFSDVVTAAAIADGQNLTHAALYPNYALFDTPLEDMYGANLPRLRAIKQAVDPKNVMGLAGGFKL
jgi:hypothetical protein